MRTCCLAYGSLLTAALLGQNPLGWLHGQPTLVQTYRFTEPLMHFGCFVMLTLACLLARWAVPRRITLMLLAIYAMATELLQGLVPGRTPEVADLLQNLGGIGVGLVLAWAVSKALPNRRPQPAVS